MNVRAIFVALFLAVFVLTGAGCKKAPTSDTETSVEGSAEVEATADDTYTSPDSYPSAQGDMTVYACDVPKDFCVDLEVTVYGNTVSAATWDGLNLYPGESYCDAEGCYFIDDMGDSWLFYF